jgi:hypothetical protein
MDERQDSPAGDKVPLERIAPQEQPAAAEPDATPPAPRKLKFLPAYQFVFDHREWPITILLAAVCLFLPVLGQVALWGFFYDLVEALHRQPNTPYPKFDFRRFGDYCVRGVWPYVLFQMIQVAIQLFVQLPLQFSIQGMAILLASNPQVGGIVLAIAAPILITFLLVLFLAVAVLTTPMLIRAGLTQDFRLVFRFAWFKDYLKRVWVEEVLATLFVAVSGALLMAAGACFFCVGLFLAIILVWMASAHLQWQIYEIYLERGGEPIPLHPLPAEAPPAAVQMP